MGLRGSVGCNCYREGKATSFPLPEFEKYFVYGEYGYWRLQLPGADNREIVDIVWKWEREQACSHRNMRYESEKISWFGVHDFKAALETVGIAHFPILSTEIPDFNGGSMSVENAAKALIELEYFNQHADFGAKIALFNSETGEVVCDYSASSNGIFIWKTDENADIGVDQDGFFVLERSHDQHPNDFVEAALGKNEIDPSRRILFRAMRLEQRSMGDKVEFYDLDTEARFISTSEIQQTVLWPDGRWVNDEGKHRIIRPKLLHVAERQVGPEEYNYIVQMLTKLCKASVETGNPIVWS